MLIQETIDGVSSGASVAEVKRKSRTPGKAIKPVAEVAQPVVDAKPVRKKSAPKKKMALAANDAPAQLATDYPIYQIYFSPSQIAHLDGAFTPLDNSNQDDPLREFAVFEKLAKDARQKKAALWGALSWRFAEKTGLKGGELRQAITQQPGFDLYYCNPYPEHEALYINGWQQGVVSHPAFTELCAAVLDAAGLDRRETSSLQPAKDFSVCNYFVATPAFWASYLPWVREVIERARANLPAPVLQVLDSRLSDPTNAHPGATYWPFIVERLLPQFMRAQGQQFKVCKLALPSVDARLNSHLQRLREMKDVAHRTRSRWMYACWLNYRNLYLMQSAGRTWCKRFLPLISVAEVEFW
jgi:hypothetical protein